MEWVQPQMTQTTAIVLAQDQDLFLFRSDCNSRFGHGSILLCPQRFDHLSPDTITSQTSQPVSAQSCPLKLLPKKMNTDSYFFYWAHTRHTSNVQPLNTLLRKSPDQKQRAGVKLQDRHKNKLYTYSERLQLEDMEVPVTILTRSTHCSWPRNVRQLQTVKKVKKVKKAL